MFVKQTKLRTLTAHTNYHAASKKAERPLNWTPEEPPIGPSVEALTPSCFDVRDVDSVMQPHIDLAGQNLDFHLIQNDLFQHGISGSVVRA